MNIGFGAEVCIDDRFRSDKNRDRGRSLCRRGPIGTYGRPRAARLYIGFRANNECGANSCGGDARLRKQTPKTVKELPLRRNIPICFSVEARVAVSSALQRISSSTLAVPLGARFAAGSNVAGTACGVPSERATRPMNPVSGASGAIPGRESTTTMRLATERRVQSEADIQIVEASWDLSSFPAMHSAAEVRRAR